jgi:hypothetical protein
VSALIGLLAHASCVTIGEMLRVAVVSAFALAFTAIAAAQPNEPPEPQNAGTKLFDEGRELAKAGNYAEACAKFEQSYALDDGVGTELNLADCKERLGHYSFAWTLFDEAARRSNDNPARAKFARDRADALTGKLATAVVNVAAPEGVTVTIDGRTVKPSAVITERVDAGTIAVHAATGQATLLDATRTVVAGATVTFDVPAVAAASQVDRGTPDHQRRTRLIVAYSIGGVGIAMLGVGMLVGLSADRAYNRDTANCTTASDGSKVCDLPSQTRALADGQLADKATIVSVIGIAAIAAGVTLYLTAPKDLVVSPMASNQTAGLAISGRF